jgi:hypothetical protein
LEPAGYLDNSPFFSEQGVFLSLRFTGGYIPVRGFYRQGEREPARENGIAREDHLVSLLNFSSEFVLMQMKLDNLYSYNEKVLPAFYGKGPPPHDSGSWRKMMNQQQEEAVSGCRRYVRAGDDRTPLHPSKDTIS